VEAGTQTPFVSQAGLGRTEIGSDVQDLMKKVTAKEFCSLIQIGNGDSDVLDSSNCHFCSYIKVMTMKVFGGLPR
jgi:hypothetical protein